MSFFGKKKNSDLEGKTETTQQDQQQSKMQSRTGTISNVLKIGMTGAYAAFFVWLFMPMCQQQSNGRLYPGYNIPQLQQKKGEEKEEKSVALIPINGMIGSDANSPANSNLLVTYIDDAIAKGADGFIFEIDSPGGVVLPSKDIVERIRRLDQPNVAIVRNLGASGAYWIASACDYIIADETSMVGSIGVRMDRFDVSGLMEKLGVKYDPVFAGAHKTMGTPFKELSDGERTILTDMVDELHDLFITSVAEGRGLPVEKVRPLADGRIFLGKDALEYGLVDHLGGRKDAAEWMYDKLKQSYDIELYKQAQQQGLFGITDSIGRSIGKGLGETFLEYNIKPR